MNPSFINHSILRIRNSCRVLCLWVLIPFGVYGQAPGNVSSNLQIWYKADSGVTGTSNVSNWADISGNGNDASQGTMANQPSLLNNEVNLNPSIHFSANSHFFNISTPPANLNTTVFTIASPAVNSTWRTMFRGVINDHPLLIESGSDRMGYYDNGNGNFKYSGFDWEENEKAVVALEMRAGDINYRKNGTQGSSITTIDLSSRNLDYFGNYQGGNQRFGKISETVIYNSVTALSTTDKEKVESYLAIKYGITLSHNYLASDGTVVWDTSSNLTYGNNIAGIARDDSTRLLQLKSKSVHGGASVTMDQSASGFVADKDYIIWGHDGGNNTSNNVPANYVLRTTRVWKIAISGSTSTIDTFKIDISTISLPNTGSASDYALLIDSDTDFSSGATEHTTGATLSGDTLTFTNLSFSNNDFFTIAAQNIAIPGGVSGQSIWIKADSGVTGTTNVSNWADISGNGNDAFQSVFANQPSLISKDRKSVV